MNTETIKKIIADLEKNKERHEGHYDIVESLKAQIKSWNTLLKSLS